MDVTTESRDKASLDIFWLRDESLEEPTTFPIPTFWPRKSSFLDLLRSGRPRAKATGREQCRGAENLEAALEQFREIVAQEMVARVLELAKIRNGDVLGKNRVRDRHGLKP